MKNNTTLTSQFWYATSVKKTYQQLDTTSQGLVPQEIKKRQKKFGPNKLPEKKPLTGLALFIKQFKGAFVYILLAAAGVSFLLHETVDASVILLAVMVNVVVGFLQERKAQRALTALKKIITRQARVMRDGTVQVIPAEELVPGDIVLLQSGDKVPADIRLTEVHNLEVAEAALTGESEPIKKQTSPLSAKDLVLGDQSNMAFMATVVTQGNAYGVVVATGSNTAIGHIATLVKETQDDPTPLQAKLDRFSKRLALIVLALSSLVFGIGVLIEHSLGEMFTIAVAIAVAAIPEGLVVTLTVILAVGMRRILKEQGLVKQLVAAETLGSTSVICTDKTGTLTQGEMRVVRIVGEHEAWEPHNEASVEHITDTAAESGLILRVITLSNDARFMSKEGERIASGSPTERAFLLAGDGVGMEKEQLEKEQPRLDTVPFESKNKYMVTLHKFSETENIVYLKGAPEKVLDFSGFVYHRSHAHDGKHPTLTPALKKKEKIQYEKMSAEGLRVLSVAYKRVPASQSSFKNVVMDNFVFIGFVGLQDPLRPDTREVIELSKQAGVATVMITGDHKLTAQAIAKDLGLPHASKNIITGTELQKLSATELKRKAPHISVYARVSPEDKLKIVNAWQERGHVVAMTGDGINDAPALKKADIGVAIGSGTDVAKETAELILLDDDFKTIVSAIRQGRVIYDNVKKVILYFLSDSFTEMMIIVTGLLLGWPLPVLAAQILWVNLVDDTLPSLALTQEPEEPEVMREQPEDRTKPILDYERKFLIILISVVTALDTLLLFWFYWQGNPDNLMHARSVAFTTLAIDSLLYIFSVRSLRKPIWKTNIFSNKFLVYSVLFGVVVQAAALYVPWLQGILRTVPLSLFDWGVIIAVSIAVIIIIELAKWVFIIVHRRTRLRKPEAVSAEQLL